jgi:toxin HigB-1
MIRGFANKTARDVYHGANSKQARKLPQELHGRARRLMDQLNAAPSLDFLLVPPGNRFEKLYGDLSGHWSLRINDQWRVVFRWAGNDAYDVSIMDYH